MTFDFEKKVIDYNEWNHIKNQKNGCKTITNGDIKKYLIKGKEVFLTSDLFVYFENRNVHLGEARLYHPSKGSIEVRRWEEYAVVPFEQFQKSYAFFASTTLDNVVEKLRILGEDSDFKTNNPIVKRIEASSFKEYALIKAMIPFYYEKLFANN